VSAAELRKAAETLRERTSQVPPSDWWEYGLDGRKMRDDGDWIVDSNQRLIAGNIGPYSDPTAKAIATYIATMQPSVGLVLADWLDGISSRHTDHTAVTKEECNRTQCCPGGCEVTYCGGCGELDYGEACSDRAAALSIARLINGGV
jgi:hypothetical protein